MTMLHAAGYHDNERSEMRGEAGRRQAAVPLPLEGALEPQ